MEVRSVIFRCGPRKLTLPIFAKDANHAQAQALDINRALDCDMYNIEYAKAKESKISSLFFNLAFNNFNHNECEIWEGSTSNKNPCFYVLNKRFYVRAAILKYLDIPRDDAVPKPRCGNPLCINPYHIEYHTEKNAKLSGGDIQMLLAFQSQGASVQQIAKALNVHRSTIYRKLKDERIHSGLTHHL